VQETEPGEPEPDSVAANEGLTAIAQYDYEACAPTYGLDSRSHLTGRRGKPAQLSFVEGKHIVGIIQGGLARVWMALEMVISPRGMSLLSKSLSRSSSLSSRNSSHELSLRLL
jgi:hypothetical protein